MWNVGGIAHYVMFVLSVGLKIGRDGVWFYAIRVGL
jgi:hypothetical protein